MKISAVIITFNEAENIKAAIESISWADEIIVVDAESTDATREIAATSGARVFVEKWRGFGKQKQFAVEQASFDWIFSLDADERVSPTLKTEILRLKNSPAEKLADGYKLPRCTFYLNKWIRHGGWYPDWQLRFFNRTKGKWQDVVIHESVEMAENSRIEKLKGDILHYSIPDASYHHRIIGERYAPLAAQKMFKNGRKTSPLKIATVGFTTFLQTLFAQTRFSRWLRRFLHRPFCRAPRILKTFTFMGIATGESVQ